MRMRRVRFFCGICASSVALFGCNGGGGDTVDNTPQILDANHAPQVVSTSTSTPLVINPVLPHITPNVVTVDTPLSTPTAPMVVITPTTAVTEIAPTTEPAITATEPTAEPAIIDVAPTPNSTTPDSIAPHVADTPSPAESINTVVATPTDLPTPPTPLTTLPPEPPKNTWAECTFTTVDAPIDTCKSPLFAPKLCLDFDRPEELTTAKITTTAIGDFPSGRSGTSFRPKGIVQLPFANAITLPTGSVSLWVAADSFEAIAKPFVLLDTNQPTNDSAFWFTAARHINQPTLQFYASELHSLAYPVTAPLAYYSTIGGVSQTPLWHWMPGEWHHVAITWDTTFVNLFVDGLNTGRIATPTVFPTGANIPSTLYLLSSKHYSAQPRPATGDWRIDLLRTYTSALSETQIRQLYRAGFGAQRLSLTAGRTHVSLLGAHDGFGLDTVRDLVSGSPLTLDIPARTLWRAEFHHLDVVNHPRVAIDNTSSTSDTPPTCAIDANTGAVRLSWQFPAQKPSGDASALPVFTMQTMLTPDVTNGIGITHTLQNLDKQWQLDAVRTSLGYLIPLSGSTEQTTTEIDLPGPNIGSAVVNPWKNDLSFLPPGKAGDIYSAIGLTAWEHFLYPNRFLTMQWTGLSDPQTQSSLYFAAHDPDAHVKALGITRNASTAGLTLDWIALPDDTHARTEEFTQTYPVVISVENGGWFALTQRYRAFAQTAPHFSPPPIAARTDLPKWYLHLGVIAASAGDGVITLQKMLFALSPTARALWHWSHWQQESASAPAGISCPGQVTSPQMNDIPFNTPLNNFATLRQSAAQLDLPFALYTNPREWDVAQDFKPERNALWEKEHGADGAYLNATADANGSFLMTDGGGAFAPTTITPQCPTYNDVVMCPASSTWQTVFPKYTNPLWALGAAGLYLDTFSCMSPVRCTAANHNHTPGTFPMVDGNRALAGLLGTTGGVLYGEGFGEPYLDLLAAHLTIYQPYQNFRPLALAVYHDRTQFLGREFWLGSHSIDAITALSGEALAWGEAPGFILSGNIFSTNPTDLGPTAVRKYLLTLAAARDAFAQYLISGRMLAPPTAVITSLTAPTTAKPLATPVSGVPAPSMAIRLMQNSATPMVQLPSVIVTAWQTNGKVGVVVVNLNRTLAGAHSLYIPIDRAAWELSGSISKITRITPTGSSNVGEVKSGGGLLVRVPATPISLTDPCPSSVKDANQCVQIDPDAVQMYEIE